MKTMLRSLRGLFKDRSSMKQVRGIWLPAHDDHFGPFIERNDGKYQYDVLEESLKYVKQRRLAVDIGGHVGLWARQLVRQFSTVYAFEPEPLVRACLARNVPESNIVLSGFALGESEGRASINFVGTNSGANWLRSDARGAVEVRSLDSFNLSHVDYVKIDVQGFEFPVVSGARETLLRDKPVIVLEQAKDASDTAGVEQFKALEYVLALGAQVRKQIRKDYILAWD